MCAVQWQDLILVISRGLSDTLVASCAVVQRPTLDEVGCDRYLLMPAVVLQD